MELHGHTGAVFSQIVNSNTDILMKKNVTIADNLQEPFYL